jgi:anti-anti-sigma factor
MPRETVPPLGVTVRWNGVVATVAVAGELDSSTAPGLIGRLLPVTAGHPERLVLDLGGLAFVDAAGARALDGTCRLLAAGCPLVVRGLRPSTRRVFELIGIGAPLGTEEGPSSPAPPGRWHQRGPQSPLDPHEAARRGTAPPDAPGRPAAGRLALLARSRAEQRRAEELLVRAQAAIERSSALAEARNRIRSGAGEPVTMSRELLAWSAYARLMARAASMPVIEQAKGIVMAQAHCGDEQAFDMLRRASQRLNVPVRELAAQVVARTAQQGRPPAAHAGNGRPAR